jgi:hypothetical protein
VLRLWCFVGNAYRDKKVVSVFVRFVQPLNLTNFFRLSNLITIKKDGFLCNIKSISNHYFKIMATHANKLFYDENKTLENNELLLKIPLQRQFEKSIKIGLESIFENQSFTKELEVF